MSEKPYTLRDENKMLRAALRNLAGRVSDPTVRAAAGDVLDEAHRMASRRTAAQQAKINRKFYRRHKRRWWQSPVTALLVYEVAEGQPYDFCVPPLNEELEPTP